MTARWLATVALLVAPFVYAADSPSPVTDRPWQEAVVSVTNLDVTARFF